ncbi:hypothetical protein PMAYCL1PPCAC_00403, partial [Pristionchus mayeri]
VADLLISIAEDPHEIVHGLLENGVQLVEFVSLCTVHIALVQVHLPVFQFFARERQGRDGDGDQKEEDETLHARRSGWVP